MAGINSYNLGNAEARISLNTDQFWTAESTARQVASQIEKHINSIISNLNKLNEAQAGANALTDVKAQLAAQKELLETLKASAASERQIRQQAHKEEMAQIQAEFELFKAYNTKKLELLQQTEKAANKLGVKASSVKPAGSASELDRERAGAQADSLLQVAIRNRDRAKQLLAEAASLRQRAEGETGTAVRKGLENQAKAAETKAAQIEQQIQDSIRKINSLRKTARQEPIREDLLTDKQRKTQTDLRVEQDRLQAEQERNRVREQQANASRIFDIEDKARREAVQAEKVANAEQIRLLREAINERLKIVQDGKAREKAINQEQKYRIVDAIDSRKKTAADTKAKEKDVDQEQIALLKRAIAARVTARNEAVKQEKSIDDAQKVMLVDAINSKQRAMRDSVEQEKSINQAQINLLRDAIANRKAVRRQEAKDEQAADKEQIARLRESIAAKKRAIEESKRAQSPKTEVDPLTKAISQSVAQSYADSVAQVNAAQVNLRKQLAAGRAVKPGVVEFQVNETELKQIEAQIAEIQSRAVGIKQALGSAFTTKEVDKYAAQLQGLIFELDALKKKQASLYSGIQSNVIGGIAPQNTVSAASIATGEQKTARLAISEATKALGEIESRFKAARVGLPITVDTTDMERKLDAAQVPIRNLKTQFAELQVELSKATTPQEQLAVAAAMKNLGAEAGLVVADINALSPAMSAFEARAKAATTGVSGYFNRLRIEIERVNRESIGAGLQQLGFSLLPIGAVGGLGVKRGIEIKQTLEETEIGFRGITNSAEEAQRLMSELADEAQRFGLPIVSSVPEFQKLLPIVNQMNYDIKDFVGYAARLATLNPAQGIEGAVRAIAELASGSGNDFVSIAERFNISRSALRQAMEETGKNIPAALEKVLSSYGRTEAVALEFGQTSRASMVRLQDAVDQFLAEAAEPLLNAMLPLVEKSTELFQIVNSGGNTLQSIAGIAMAATAGIVTLTIAMGQLMIAIDAIKASFLAAAVTNPLVLTILGIAAAVGAVAIAVNAAQDAIDSAAIETSRQNTQDERSRLQSLGSFGEQRIAYNTIESVSLPAIGSMLNDMRNQVQTVEPIRIPAILVLDEMPSAAELFGRGWSGEASGLPPNNIPYLDRQQADAESKFAANIVDVVGGLSDAYFDAIDKFLSSNVLNQQLPAVVGEMTQLPSSAGMDRFIQAYAGGNVTDQELYGLTANELSQIADIMLGSSNEITMSFQDVAAAGDQAEQSAQEIRDSLLNSADLIKQAEAQIAVYNLGAAASRMSALTGLAGATTYLQSAGAINNQQRLDIMGEAAKLSTAQINELSAGLQEFAAMLTDLNTEIARTLEDRARSEAYEIADNLLQRQRAYEDYARNQARAEDDYRRSISEMYDDYYKTEAEAVKENEKQKKEVTERAQEQAQKALEDHLIEMQRMSRDVDESIAARDFASAQKQIQNMRDRQEDFDREAEERRKDLEEQLEELTKNLEEQRDKRREAFEEQLRDAERQYQLQKQRQEEDFRLSLAREDQDRQIRLWRQQEEYRIMDARRMDDFNNQVRQLISHNEVMRFNQSYWSGILEQDYAAFFARVHQQIQGQTYAPQGTAPVQTAGLPGDIADALADFYDRYTGNQAGVQVPGGWIPQYADGVDFINREGLAYLHYGERVSKSADGLKERTSSYIERGGSMIFSPNTTLEVSVTVNGNVDEASIDEMASEIEYRLVPKIQKIYDDIYRQMRNNE